MAVFASRQIVLHQMVNYVNFIQSNGTQYFDTGFVPDNNTRVIVDIELLEDNNNATLFGARSSATSNNYAVMWTNKVLRSDYNNAYTQKWNVEKTKRRVIDKNKETTTIDGVSQSYVNASFRAPGTMMLLALNNNGNVKWQTAAKLYSCKVYDNGLIIRDYWPCYDPDGVACLYDKVEKKYYYNAGSGEFTAGGAT